MNSRGGKRIGAGRPKKPDSEKTYPYMIKLTKKERASYLKKGGAKWLRPQLQED